MKKGIAFFLLWMMSTALFAQEEITITSGVFSENDRLGSVESSENSSMTVSASFTGKQQIAFRLLNNYLYEKQAADLDRSGGYWAIGVGSVLGATGAGLYFFGEDLFGADPSGEETPVAYQAIGIGLGIGGAAAITGGILELTREPYNFEEDYATIYEEKDPELQEALAASALYTLSEQGRNDRITDGIFQLSVPLLAGGLTIANNLANGKEWYDNLFSVSSSTIYQIIGGFTAFFEKSEAEMLYEEYEVSQRVYYGMQ